jgi:hypothetical protein
VGCRREVKALAATTVFRYQRFWPSGGPPAAGNQSKKYLTLIHKKVSTGLSDLSKKRADFVAAVRENSPAY